jgi:peptidoglycan/LPS O-acetylase OafA/YrhL
MSLPDEVGAADPRILRVLAGVGVALIPLAWLGSLAAESALLHANIIRVLGALLTGGIAWVTHNRSHERGRGGLPWGRCLAAGVVGSLAVTGISMLAPALGGFTLAGWLMSGVVGGVMVVLAGYALTAGSTNN